MRDSSSTLDGGLEMGYMPKKKITLEEVQKLAREPEGQTARDALLAADKHEGEVAFYMTGQQLTVVPVKN